MSLKFRLSITADNAAFDDTPELELVRILRDITTKLEDGDYNGDIRDINGNIVGMFRLNESKDSELDL